MTGIEHDTVTALDYIEKQEQLEKEAQSILPGKFEKCTFPLGYVRQPLYACKTCSIDNEEPAGMCYSCSIACHASHELFELFPKREFRCDCGLQGKFAGHCCSLMIPAKKIVKSNDKNTYNHNFDGRYCRCDQHYDPEKEEGTMYQCVACEDWFHETCIGNIPDAINDFECYICRCCTKKLPFLMNGKDERFSIGLSTGNESISKWIVPQSQIGVVDIISVDGVDGAQIKVDDAQIKVGDAQIKVGDAQIKVGDAQIKVGDAQIKVDILDNSVTIEETGSIAVSIKDTNTSTDHENNISEISILGEKRKYEEESQIIIPNTFKKLKTDQECENIEISLLPTHDNIEIFLQDGWREGLCKCLKCVLGYKINNVEFLLAEEKTYEPEEDEDAGKSLLEVGMEQLQRVDRVQALESLMAYKTLADDLKSYFETFKDSGKIVTKQDIDDFFSAKRREKE